MNASPYLPRRIWSEALPLLVALGMIAIFAPFSLAGQEAVVEPSAPLPPPMDVFSTVDSTSSAISPRGAFIRSLLIPGWGQVASGSIGRGGFYFAAQTASYWTLLKSVLAKGEAETFTRLEREIVTAKLIAAGVEDPVLLQAGVDNDSEVKAWENLTELRSQQIEDWAALSIFLTLLGGADAIVAAHLSDYPEPLTIRILPGGLGQRIEMGLTFPAGGMGR